MKLFAICNFCFTSGCKAMTTSVIGDIVIITQLCAKCGETRIWPKSPYIGTIPSCKLLLLGAILFWQASRKNFSVLDPLVW